MAQTAVTNYQASLALTFYTPLDGIYPSANNSDWELGDIGIFAGNFSPGGALANGSVLSVSGNSAVASVFGTTYGGNGITTFGLPNLGGRTIVGVGQGAFLDPVVIGQQLGTASTALGYAQTPTNIGGQSQAFDNHEPSLGIRYAIVVSGIYPSGFVTPNSLGTIRQVAAATFSEGALLECDGRLLSIAHNTALFSILGTTYGGNGVTTFALPDLRGRDIIGASAATPIGTVVGQSDVALANGQAPDGLGGGVTPIDNRQPSLAMQYVICTEGIYPDRDSRGQDPSEPVMGQIMAFAGSLVPERGAMVCDGSLLSIEDNTALFSIIGTTYGGDGITTFALPDLRGRTVIGAGGTFVPGEVVGQDSTTITSAMLPDTPPVIISNGGGATASITLVTSQALVTTLAASDIDAGQTVSFSIIGGEDQALFTVVGGNQLEFITAPDLDALPTQGATPGYQVNVRASDGFGGYDSQLINVYLSANPHQSGASVSYVDAIGGVYVDLATQVGERADAGLGWTGGPLSQTPIAIDNFSGVHKATGSGFDDLLVAGTASAILSGLAGADTLNGSVGDDRLDGGAGADLTTGGAGNDFYYVDDAGDQVIEAGGGGIDRVLASVNYTLTAGQEIDLLTPVGAGGVAPVLTTNPLNLTGNELANTIWGDAAANVLDGAAGNDALYGFDGADQLNGGAGNDILIGGAGNDSLDGGAGDDRLIGAAGAEQMTGGDGNDMYYVDDAGDQVIEAGGGGSDRVLASVNYTLTAGQEIDLLTPVDVGGVAPVLTTNPLNLTGNELANTIWGNAAANVLDGAAGNDALRGFDGDDQLFGSAGNDILNGGAGNDSLDGGAGDDRLIGEAGADQMTGGDGNDMYYVDDAGDQVIEAGGGGSDRVLASVNYTLTAGQEIELLTPLDAGGVAPVLTTNTINLMGNELSNTIWGNAAANVLDGAAGDDILYGFDGDDTLNGGEDNDKLIGGGGEDTIVFDSLIAGGTNIDTVGDFNASIDSIRLDDAIFAGLSVGSLAGSQFHVGTAVGASAQIVYDSGSGALYYDSNGSIAGGATQFATLAGAPTLAASDIVVV